MELCFYDLLFLRSERAMFCLVIEVKALIGI